MSTPPAQLFVLVSGDLACVKIVGRATFTSSVDLKAVFNELVKDGYTCYILDLTECLLMDSTFLGVMTGLALKFQNPPYRNGHETVIELLNPNERNLQSLESLGVLALFKVVSGNGHLPAELRDLGPVACSAPSREQVTSNCLEAHKVLMDVCPDNVPKFKEVTQFLTENLKKIKRE